MDTTQILAQAREARKQHIAARPTIERECICRNNHEPDEHGFIYLSPSCLVHAPRKAYIGGSPRLASAIERREVENEAREAERIRIAKQRSSRR